MARLPPTRSAAIQQSLADLLGWGGRADSPAPERAHQLIQWDNGAGAGAGEPDYSLLVGADDAYEHTPLQAGERVAYCTVDKVAFHLATWQFFCSLNQERRLSQDRCCLCGQSGVIRIIQLPQIASPCSPLPAPAPTLPKPAPAVRPGSLDIICLADAPRYLNRMAVLEAYVHEVYRTMSSGSYFIRFEPRLPGAPVYQGFKVCIRRAHLSAWDAAHLSPDAYAQKTVRVRGVIQQHPDWGLEMLINSPRAIRILAPAETG